VHEQSAGPVVPVQTWPAVQAAPAPAMPSQSQTPPMHSPMPQSMSESHAQSPVVQTNPLVQLSGPVVHSQVMPAPHEG